MKTNDARGREGREGAIQQASTCLQPIQRVEALQTAHKGHKAMKLKLYYTNTKRQLFIASCTSKSASLDHFCSFQRLEINVVRSLIVRSRRISARRTALSTNFQLFFTIFEVPKLVPMYSSCNSKVAWKFELLEPPATFSAFNTLRRDEPQVVVVDWQRVGHRPSRFFQFFDHFLRYFEVYLSVLNVSPIYAQHSNL